MQSHILRLTSLILLAFLAATGDVEPSEFCGPGSLGGCGDRAADPVVSTSGNKNAPAVQVPSAGERLSSADATPSVPPLGAASATPEAADCADGLGSAGGSRSLQGSHSDASLPTTTCPVGAPNDANSVGAGQVGALASDAEAQGPFHASQPQQQPDEEPRGAPVKPSDAAAAYSTVQSSSTEPQAAVPRDVGLQGSAGSPDPSTAPAGSVECAPRAETQDSPSTSAGAPQHSQPNVKLSLQQQSLEPSPLPHTQSPQQPPPPPPQPSDAAPTPATSAGATTTPAPPPPPQQQQQQQPQTPQPQSAQPPSAPPAPEQRKRSSHTAIPKPDDFVLSMPTTDLSLSVLGPDSGGVVGAQAAAQLGLAAFTGEDVLGEALLGALIGDADARLAAGEGAPGGLEAAVGGGAAGPGAAASGQLLDSEYEEEEGRKINLASASDGASIVAANKEAKRSERLIDGDDDSYMKNACSASKWVIVELSQLGRVDEIKLTMKEMYSSRVRDFVVKGRQSHPKKDGLVDYSKGLESEGWQLLGLFHAENRKGSQVFQLPRKARVRYLLLQVLSHYGTEEMCALNSMEVRGVTAAQELEAALSRPLNAHPPPAAAAAAAAPVRGASAAAAVQHNTASGNGGPTPPPSPEVVALGGQAGKQVGAPAAAPAAAATSATNSSAPTGAAHAPAQDVGQGSVPQQQPQHQQGVSSGDQGLGSGDGGEAAAVRAGSGSTEAAGGQQTGAAEGAQAKDAAATGQGNAGAGLQAPQGGSCNVTTSGHGIGTGSSANSSSCAAPGTQGVSARGQANPPRPPSGSGSPQQAAAGAAQPEAQGSPARQGTVEATAGGTEAPTPGASSPDAAQAVAKGHDDAAAAEERGGCEGAKASQGSGPAAEDPSTASGGAAPPQPIATPEPTAGAANGAAGAAAAESAAAQPQVQQRSQQHATGTPATEVSGAPPNGSDGSGATGDSKADGQAGAFSGPGPSSAEACAGSEAPATPAPGAARPDNATTGSTQAGSAGKAAQAGAAPPAGAPPNASSPNASGACAPPAPEDIRTTADASQAPPTAGSGAAEAAGVGAAAGAGHPADASARGAGTGVPEPQGAGSSGVPPVNSQGGAGEAERRPSCGGGSPSQPSPAANGVAAGPAAEADVSVPTAPAVTGGAAQTGAAAPPAGGASIGTGVTQAPAGTNVTSTPAAATAPVPAGGAASEQLQPQAQAQQLAAEAPSAAVTLGGDCPASTGVGSPASAPAPTAASPAPPGNGEAAATPTHTAGAGSLPRPTPLASTPQEAWSVPPVQGPTAAAPATPAAPSAGAGAAAAPAAAPVTAGAPPPIPSLDSILSMLEGGAASKPRLAGNLFDVIKQEMMMLKLNQTRLWQYIHALVDALNARHAELEADALAMEDKMAHLDTQAALTAQAVARAREASLAPIAALTARVTELEERAGRAEALGTVVLLYSSTILAAAAMAGLTSGGSRVVKWLMALLGVANGVAGLALHGSLLQGGLALYGKTAAGNAAQLLAQASDVLRWRR